MPQLGEIKRGGEIRKIGNRGYTKYIWAACEICGKQRWVHFVKGKAVSLKCKSCKQRLENTGVLGEKSRSWQGGRYKDAEGYIRVRIYPDDFFYPMSVYKGKSGAYLLEHRLVVAKALNRCLLPWEIVHHKGTKYPMGSQEDKSDNRYPENLELLPSSYKHNAFTTMRTYIKKLEREIERLLETEERKYA